MPHPPITYPEPVPIDAYGPGFFRIANQKIAGAIIILPTKTTSCNGYPDTAPILAAAQIDVLIIGTGAEITHLPTAFKTALEAAAIGFEPMSSPSACRLYNILVSEGRRLACALLPI